MGGDEFVVSKRKLVLNVNAPGAADQAYERFFQIVSLLVNAAIPGALRNGRMLDIKADDPPLIVNGYALALIRNDWLNGIKGGHDLAYTVEIADYSQAKLNAVARQLNNRPRKTLDYETPAERFNQTVASIG